VQQRAPRLGHVLHEHPAHAFRVLGGADHGHAALAEDRCRPGMAQPDR